MSSAAAGWRSPSVPVRVTISASPPWRSLWRRRAKSTITDLMARLA
jgi:hypothetical protein